MHISLITGLFPPVVSALTMLVLTVVVVRPTPYWARRVAVLAMVSAGIMLATALFVGRLHLFDFTFPWSFYAWVGLVVFALALAVWSWAGTPLWRRVTAGVAGPP